MTTLASYGDFATYGIDPWNNIELNERPWYDPLLRDWYMRNSVYSQHVTFNVDLNGPKARTIYFNDLIPPRPNIAPLDARQMEATRLYSDSFQREVTTERYGNGMALHRESQMFSYWEKNGAVAGLMNIINAQLGQVIIDHLDVLARNEFFRHPYALKGLNGATGFSGIGETDKMSSELVDNIWLRLRDRTKLNTALPQQYISGNEIVCLTTAGAVHDLKRETTGTTPFVDVVKYADGQRLIRGELGTWRGVRFVDSPFAKLWNMGETDVQAEITGAVKPGDGAPDPRTTKVEHTRKVGQPGSKHYIQVDDVTGFSAGDMISIHQLVHDATSLAADGGRGVVGGPVFDDPMKQDVEIHSIDTGNNRIVLKEPYMMTADNGEGLETEVSTGVYGYVTKGKTIHSAMFLVPGISNNALVCGVAQPPTIYTPPAFDDYMSIYRIAYDMWMKYALWEARSYEMVFLRGPNALIQGGIFR